MCQGNFVGFGGNQCYVITGGISCSNVQSVMVECLCSIFQNVPLMRFKPLSVLTFDEK